MKKFLLFMITLFFPFFINAKEMKLEWSKNLSDKKFFINQSVLTNNNEFIMIGNIYEDENSSYRDAYIFKLDKDGNKLWEKSLGGSKNDEFEKILILSDDSYVVFMRTNSIDIPDLVTRGNEDIVIVRYDKEGNMLWKTAWGGSDSDYLNYTTVLEDDSFVLVGSTFSKDISGLNVDYRDGFLLKYDKDGNLLWQNNWGGNGDDSFNSLIVDDEDNIIVVGSCDSENIDGFPCEQWDDAIIVKYDKNGKEVWKKKYGGSNFDSFGLVLLTNDGNYLSFGTTESNDIDGVVLDGYYNVLMVKYDKDGNIIWRTTWGGMDFFQSPDIKINEKNEIILTGTFSSKYINGVSQDNKGLDGILIKFDQNGKEIWHQRFGTFRTEYFIKTILMNDGGYLVGAHGNHNEDDSWGYHIYFLKYDKDGNLEWEKKLNSTGYENFKDSFFFDNKYIARITTRSKEFEGIVNEDENTIDGLLCYKFEYLINLSVGENGKANAVQNGGVGVITPDANDGYLVNKIIVKDSRGNEIDVVKQNVGTYIFELYDDVSVDVSFIKDHKIKVVDAKNGEVNVNKIDGGHVVVSYKPNNGFEFDKLIVKNSNDESVNFVKQEDGTCIFELNDDVSVEVVFKKELVNPKTGGVDIFETLVIGFVISFIGFILVRKNCSGCEI